MNSTDTSHQDPSREEETENALSKLVKELALQNIEKEKRAAELLIANKELAFQNVEKDKRASEMSDANKELAFQTLERDKRAAELSIANTELAFQNDQKEKRAAELLIANKELAFQNAEKDKRDGELAVANKELAYQTLERDKRAAELIIANTELAFQNEQKEKRAAELIIANEDLDAYCYSVSHDLRQPLRVITGFATILEEDYGSKFDAEALRLTNIIKANTAKIESLIDNLLAFARMGSRSLNAGKFDTNDLVNEVIRDLTKGMDSSNIEWVIPSLPGSRGDINAIRQVWINFISNAIKYSASKKSPQIEIGGTSNDEQTTFFIKDNGVGFDKKYDDKLFKVFQRLHSLEEFDGLGIGLAWTAKIVSRHGGKVWAETGVDDGATFYFSLPI
jgi:K+-sensing histidine kinase KdpD